MLSEYITPAVLLAAIIAVWRFLHADIKSLGNRIDELNRRIDAHLEGHAPKP